MPAVEDRLALARRTMIALVVRCELPPKLGVHPREPAAHTAAMPALLRGAAASGEQDLLGVKWVTAFPGNRARGLPGVSAPIILSDPLTGLPVVILDGAPDYRAAHGRGQWRGAARVVAGWSARATVSIIGAGVQGAAMSRCCATLRRAGYGWSIADGTTTARRSSRGRAERATRPAFGEVSSTTDVTAAVGEADVVLTMVSFGPQRQTVPAQAFRTSPIDHRRRLRHVHPGKRRGAVAPVPRRRHRPVRSDAHGRRLCRLSAPGRVPWPALTGSAPALRASGPSSSITSALVLRTSSSPTPSFVARRSCSWAWSCHGDRSAA